MRNRWLRTRLVPSFLVWAMVAAVTSNGSAQTTPKIESLFPPGGQRGTQVEVQFTAEYLPGPCPVVVTGQGIVLERSIAADRFAVSLAADAEVGAREVRVVSPQGSSAPFPFLVGDLPEVVRTDTRTPLELKLPVTVNSRLTSAGSVDDYVLNLTAGQQIVCAAAARAFKSPVEASLRLLDSDQRVVATSFDHHSADALLVFRAKTAGRYTLQVYDFQMLGGPQHIYRLTVTDGPWLDYAYPAGLQKGVETAVTLLGWNLPSPDGRTLQHRMSSPAAGVLDFVLAGGANRLAMPVGEHPEVLEAEPNNLLTQAQAITLPATLNGWLGQSGDVDMFAVTAAKGDRWVLEAESANLKFPTDLVLSIADEMGKTLAEADDNGASRDPELRFTVPADGRYVVTLRDRSRSGGDECIYRLRVGPLRPDVTARVNVSSLALTSGETTNLAVIVDRRDEFAGVLELTALDLPNGVSIKPQPVPEKTPATIQLPLEAAANLSPVSGLVRIVVRGTDSKQAPLERVALVAETPQAVTGSRGLWVAVSPVVPFTLSTTTTILEVPRLAAFPFPVKVERKAGFVGPIRLVGVEPDKRGTVVPLEGRIEADSKTGTIPLVIQQGVTEGTTHRCRVMGIADVLAPDGKSYPVFQVAGGTMLMGCQPSLLTMTTEPAQTIWRPGESVRIQVQLMRRVAMQPVTLRLQMPERGTGITCEPVTVAVDQSSAELTLHFARDASLPARTTLTIQATSSREGLPIQGLASFRLETP